MLGPAIKSFQERSVQIEHCFQRKPRTHPALTFIAVKITILPEPTQCSYILPQPHYALLVFLTNIKYKIRQFPVPAPPIRVVGYQSSRRQFRRESFVANCSLHLPQILHLHPEHSGESRPSNATAGIKDLWPQRKEVELLCLRGRVFCKQ